LYDFGVVLLELIWVTAVPRFSACSVENLILQGISRWFSRCNREYCTIAYLQNSFCCPLFYCWCCSWCCDVGNKPSCGAHSLLRLPRYIYATTLLTS